MRSLFFAMEGIDGSGGTTQTAKLVAWLQAHGASEVVTTCEPSDGPVGRFIRAALAPGSPESRLGDAVLPYLFSADRRDHLDREIIPALQRGAVVVTDRYYLSSLAYQSLSVGFAQVVALNDGFRRPDLTIFLDLEPEVSLARVEARGEPLERFEALDRLREVREAYAAGMVHCRTHGERIVRINASGSPDEVHARVVAEVAALLAAGPSGSL
jgi:dTMP kinase